MVPENLINIFRHILTGVILTVFFFMGMYFVLVTYILEVPFIGLGLWAPSISGTVLGIISGFLYNQRSNNQTSLLNALEQQRILKEISLLPHQNISVVELLNKTIRFILDVSFAKLQSKGGIFITSTTKQLVLKSHLNLDKSLVNNCGKGVRFGDCLCGLAAEKRETIFKNCVDKEHTFKYGGMSDHGHYNVPITHENDVLGVIVIYLDVKHKRNSTEIDFLEAVANVLALILKKYSVDQTILMNESVLREVQEFAGIGTWTLNINTGKITASDEVYDIMGYQPQQLSYTEEDFLKSIHPSDINEMKNILVSSKKGKPFEVEMRHFKKDGSIAHIINKCKPKVLENGEINELAGTIIDVSKMRFNEAELKEKQDLVKSILSATPDMLYLVDLDTNSFVYYNAEMEKVLRKNPEFLINYKKKGVKYFGEFVHPEDRGLFASMDNDLRSGKEFTTINYRIKGFTDEYRWYEQRIFVYNRSKEGRIHQVLIISKDIHEKFLAEENIKELNEKLLVQYKNIKKVNTELDQFVYSVSHDLRAPLSSILGLVNLSKNDSSEKLLKECMVRIGTSVEKLDSFIQDILNYSRNSRTEVATDSFSIEELINELIANIKLLRDPNIKIILKADENITYVGDRKRISIVLNNIISNACKYADFTKHNRKIKISVRTSKKGCKLSIEDNGIGIKVDSLDKIFDMFYRGTEASEGSGLGLYIVKESITKLNGFIDIKSEEGVGTNISIEIPHSITPMMSKNLA